MSPIGFSDPGLLWILPLATLVTVATWWVASRALPRGRRIASLVIRLVLVACLVGAVAGARITVAADRLAVIFLVDASASMVEASRDDLVELARDTLREMPDGDLAGVVAFGANALVDRLPSDDRDLQAPASVPVAGATDIGAAIRLASAILPAGMQHRQYQHDWRKDRKQMNGAEWPDQADLMNPERADRDRKHQHHPDPADGPVRQRPALPAFVPRCLRSPREPLTGRPRFRASAIDSRA